MRPGLHSFKTAAPILLVMIAAQQVVTAFMKFYHQIPALVAGVTGHLPLSTAQGSWTGGTSSCPSESNISLSWYPPDNYYVNDLASVINGTGVYGFVFDTSQGPLNTYNWCNMPHVNVQTYPRASSDYKLEYVELIHRHHKRTPYASNTFPVEPYSWSCSDEGLFYSGKPLNPYGNASASTYWSVYTSESNPFPSQGFNGTCQFPQITRGGLDDSHQHGVDLKSVYSELLDFLPRAFDSTLISWRVTNNVITSQVAGMVVAGMYRELQDRDTPLLIQQASIDSLEPTYSCGFASNLYNSYGPTSSYGPWLMHLADSQALYDALDNISGVNPNDEGFHKSWDHYFDDLSARQCANKALPCKIGDPSSCVTQTQADEVYRLGEYEYSFIYRDHHDSLTAAVGSYGVWVAELAQNLRQAMGHSESTPSSVRYRHNIAHDGSISRLLSILQIDRMVWPGMGAEVVFELYSKNGCYYLRVLWGGQVLTSSHPAFGRFDMVPVDTFLAYVDGLVGVKASKIPEICNRQ